MLKKEINFYDGDSGDYNNSDDKEAIFIQNIENLISREHNL